ncbi:hypothetical protein QM716_02030 [Rhodococcus sp. IEGM 1409]|uniref:hypothetical protein n=1 Tax=Rhodococcus sp. IEGM 1409 TaxID=3047082 RepID=UPI0024B76BFB|nr:hypothetical protein [Rhodococcus sp. IEGM 1409]MDI9898628.1 hypothetical protein [Rhodococcus sp. IEGM 1409]
MPAVIAVAATVVAVAAAVVAVIAVAVAVVSIAVIATGLGGDDGGEDRYGKDADSHQAHHSNKHHR